MLNILFPRTCYLCKKPGLYFCTSCQKKLPFKKDQLCFACNKKTTLGYTHSSCSSSYFPDLSISLFHYQPPIRTALHDLKYRFVSDLAKELSLLTLNQLKGKYKPLLSLWGQKKFVLVPVPLYKTRKNFRGFNQTEIIGKLIAKNLNLSFQSLLKRNKPTRPQHSLSSSLRKKNLKTAFSISDPSFPLPKNILLFDDIHTSGSTLSACTKTLKDQKDITVHSLTLAR